jgi:hypothetical protein
MVSYLKIFILCLAFLLCCQTGFAKNQDQNELRIVNDVQVNFNDVSGPGRSASSLTDGTTYIENLNIYARGKKDDFKYTFNLGGRTTNDDRYDSDGKVQIIKTLTGKFWSVD